MPEYVVQVVREHEGGARSIVTELTTGPDFDVKVERDKDTGRNTIVVKSKTPEADDAVLRKTHEHVRRAPNSDAKMAKTQLTSEGGVHLAKPSDGKQVADNVKGAGTAAMPTGPDGVASPDQPQASEGGADTVAKSKVKDNS